MLDFVPHCLLRFRLYSFSSSTAIFSASCVLRHMIGKELERSPRLLYVPIEGLTLYIRMLSLDFHPPRLEVYSILLRVASSHS